jgi:hypothetical protein
MVVPAFLIVFALLQGVNAPTGVTREPQAIGVGPLLEGRLSPKVGPSMIHGSEPNPPYGAISQTIGLNKGRFGNL